MKLRNVSLILFSALLLVMVSCQFREPGENKDLLRVTGNIVCTCGCPPTLVRACSCGRAAEMTEEVRGMLAQGKSDEEIYASYVAQFGPSVRAAPRAEGFNLLGWIFPFIAALSGGALVAAVYHSLKKKKVAETDSSALPEQLKPHEAEKYREMLARELAD
jgi:cytochrome c-type biogenesis protein CcmH